MGTLAPTKKGDVPGPKGTTLMRKIINDQCAERLEKEHPGSQALPLWVKRGFFRALLSAEVDSCCCGRSSEDRGREFWRGM